MSGALLGAAGVLAFQGLGAVLMRLFGDREALGLVAATLWPFWLPFRTYHRLKVRRSRRAYFARSSR